MKMPGLSVWSRTMRITGGTWNHSSHSWRYGRPRPTPNRRSASAQATIRPATIPSGTPPTERGTRRAVPPCSGINSKLALLLINGIEILPREDRVVVPAVHPRPHRIVRHRLHEEQVRQIVVGDHRDLLVQRLALRRIGRAHRLVDQPVRLGVLVAAAGREVPVRR